MCIAFSPTPIATSISCYGEMNDGDSTMEERKDSIGGDTIIFVDEMKGKM